jgi:NAD(P) transhydrogenase subunit alpha
MNQVLRGLVSLILLLVSLTIFSSAFAADPPVAPAIAAQTGEGADSAVAENAPSTSAGQSYRGLRLMSSFTVFLLAVFVGFEVITKVPPTLHTPLMSGSNAISGITVVGALLTAGHVNGGFGALLGLLAVLLAFVNVVGGFVVTHRMLMMFKKR